MAWLSLDELDSDLRQFLTYFLAAVQIMFPGAMGETATLKLGVKSTFDSY
jgi:ATP/maltotriose-dependent transcriptional regulator MalT